MNADGDDTFNRKLSINGRTKWITKNLFEGLLRLRTDAWPSPRRLWIDAICINQSDDDERSQQVSIMAKIYQGASRTVIWLGEGESAREDLNILKMIECHEQAPGISHPSGTHIWQGGGDGHHDICSLQLHKYGLYGQPGGWRPLLSQDCLSLLQGVGRFFSRRYFLRRWIFQELFHSPRSTTVAFWGACCCLMSKLARINHAVFRLTGKGSDEQEMPLYSDDSLLSRWLLVQNFLDPIFAPHYSAPTPSWNLLDAFVTCYHMQCSDPRDRVYSLLSVGNNFGITPDYSLSLDDVTAKFARRLADGGYLDVVLASNSRSQSYWDIPGVFQTTWNPNVWEAL